MNLSDISKKTGTIIRMIPENTNKYGNRLWINHQGGGNYPDIIFMIQGFQVSALYGIDLP